MTLISILAATTLIATVSIIGITLFYFKESKLSKFLLSLVALSAGAMLGNSLFHLLPEAIEEAEIIGMSLSTTLLILTGGFVLAFLFEQLFAWHGCHTASHHDGKDPGYHCHREEKPFAHLVLLSDGVHNFIDGLILAAAFLVSPALGITTTIAIALHEVPQELGDYAVLVYGGYKKSKALLFNFLAASTVVLGGVAGFFLAGSVENTIPILLPFAAGSFLYIAAADLLPELKHDEKIRETALHFCIFLLGLLLMIGFAQFE